MKENLQKKASFLSLTLSEYFRQLCLCGDAKQIPESVVVDLRRLGINMNQIAKRLNGGSIAEKQVFEELNSILNDLKKINLR